MKVVFLRHGQSTWNLENRFTGWTDVDLSARGVQEAQAAGRLLREHDFHFDVAFSSVLKRAIRTLWIALDEMDLMWLPVIKDWRLNERHYGELQGLSKREMTGRFGEEQVHRWRRGYATRPPALGEDDIRHARFDPRYRALDPADLPATESLEDCLHRVLPYWEREIVPRLASKHKVLISAHGNSLRALVKKLDDLSDDEIVDLNIPTGIPLVYEFDDDMRVQRRYYLADTEQLDAAVAEVRNQTVP